MGLGASWAEACQVCIQVDGVRGMRGISSLDDHCTMGLERQARFRLQRRACQTKSQFLRHLIVVAHQLKPLWNHPKGDSVGYT